MKRKYLDCDVFIEAFGILIDSWIHDSTEPKMIKSVFDNFLDICNVLFSSNGTCNVVFGTVLEYSTETWMYCFVWNHVKIFHRALDVLSCLDPFFLNKLYFRSLSLSQDEMKRCQNGANATLLQTQTHYNTFWGGNLKGARHDLN